MRKFTDELHQKVQLSIQNVSDLGEVGFEFYNSCYSITKAAMGELKEYVYKYRFKDREEEITFFKEIKPTFLAQLQYYKELLEIEVKKPTITEKRFLIKYYQKTARYYQMVLKKNDLFRQYLRSGNMVSDHQLFVRSEVNNDLFPSDAIDLDEKFSTVASNELSKIKSHEMVLEFLCFRIEALKVGDSKIANEPSENYDTVWTGDKVKLIELAYALYASGDVNNGRATIKQIINALERAFNIDLSGFYRVFQNIRIRLSGRTNFLDFLKTGLTKFMDETDLNYKA